MFFVISLIQKIFKKTIVSLTVSKSDFYIHLNDVNVLRSFLLFLKNSTWFQCKQLLDIVCVDYPTHNARFELTYVLLSVRFNFRFFIKICVLDQEAVPTISDIFLSGNWLEREIWDMFGVFFQDHPDLRRILTDYGFVGYPLRKDFPLTGFVELRYDDTEKRIVQEALDISQEFRFFSFLMPWEKEKKI